MIKMIATDIDGTILKWGLDFSPKLLKCVEELKEVGVKLVLVTGRMHCAAIPVAQKLGIDTPIISYQGGLIKDFNNSTLYQRNLPNEYAKEIIKWARKNKIHINLCLDDKLYVGFYRHEKLIGIMDLILHYPVENSAYIGLFMTDKAYQNKGVGSIIIEECLTALKEKGFSSVRLGYMKVNIQSRNFWMKNRFVPTGEERENDHGMVVMMERKIV